MPIEAEPLVRHLFAHPFLFMLHQIDQNHRSTGTSDTAKSRRSHAAGSGRKCSTITQNAASTLARIQRQLECIALAEFDVVDRAFLCHGARPAQHFLG